MKRYRSAEILAADIAALIEQLAGMPLCTLPTNKARQLAMHLVMECREALVAEAIVIPGIATTMVKPRKERVRCHAQKG